MTERYLRGRTEFSTRLAGPDDADAISRLHIASWQWAYAGLLPADHLDRLPEKLPERIVRWRGYLAEQDDDRVYAAVNGDGEVIGMIMAGRYREQDHRVDGIGEIYAIYLTRAVVGTGVGRALMDTAVDWLAGRGLSDVRLWVFEGNARARAFYDRYGFRFDGGRTDYVLDRPGTPTVVVPEIRMSLSLGIGGQSPGRALADR